MTDPFEPTSDYDSGDQPEANSADYETGEAKLLEDLSRWVRAGEPDIWPEPGVGEWPTAEAEPENPGDDGDW
ncbi:MAG: hypothetical protein H7Y37_13615 [Anaerolineae bacterium]|nr:hypothetical protein [Gloeobacterales cyanobacterium ES-bin-313]